MSALTRNHVNVLDRSSSYRVELEVASQRIPLPVEWSRVSTKNATTNRDAFTSPSTTVALTNSAVSFLRTASTCLSMTKPCPVTQRGWHLPHRWPFPWPWFWLVSACAVCCDVFVSQGVIVTEWSRFQPRCSVRYTISQVLKHIPKIREFRRRERCSHYFVLGD